MKNDLETYHKWLLAPWPENADLPEYCSQGDLAVAYADYVTKHLLEKISNLELERMLAEIRHSTQIAMLGGIR